VYLYSRPVVAEVASTVGRPVGARVLFFVGTAVGLRTGGFVGAKVDLVGAADLTGAADLVGAADLKGARVGGREGRVVGMVVSEVGEAVGTAVPRPVNTFEKAVKLTEPSPVAGSQPALAVKPCAQHTEVDEVVVERVHLLLPLVMSFVKSALYW
jgi:hypothetical protein